MEDGIEDIDLSETNIHNFLYNQGMRASRVREIYRLCFSNITPQPNPFIFGDEADRDRHALRRFRNALTMDLVPNVQYAYQQCGLRDDGQGMTPEELLEKVAELRLDDSDGTELSKDGEIEAGEGSCAKEDLGGESGRTCTELKPSREEENIGATDDPLHSGMDSETRQPVRWREPHTENLTTRTKPACIPPEKITGQGRTYASESSATDNRAVPRGFRTQNRRPVSHVQSSTNPKGPSVVPAKAPQLQTVCTSTRRVIHRSASAHLNSTLRPRPTVKNEAERIKLQPSPPTITRFSKTSPGQIQRPLSLPTGLTRATPASLIDTPVRRWR